MNSETRGLSDPYPRLAAEGRVDFQPKGVVGNISPWNFPVNLTFSPLSAMLAAGNRVMIKPSEYTPETSRLMAELVADYFDESEIAVFPGGPEVGRIFAGLPFDHLLFTGATEVGRHILRAAAENLVPVTLELGGKSPVIVGRSADLDQAADRIILGKMLNAGQICLAPDYILAPRENETLLVEALIRQASAAYPDVAGNGDYGAVINDRHRARLDAHIADARTKGAEVIEVNPAEETLGADQIKRPLTLLRGAHDQMTAMREEIFGPVLPIVAYDTIEEAVAYVNGRPRPLGLYYFGTDRAEEDLVVTQTTSGGVTVNDVLQHVAHEELPFGGVGPSGMGAYHGLDGFRTFSHAKTVYRQTLADLAGMAGSRPPYGEGLNSVLSATITK
jgi:coniferyl-aldehyde dehydrogenase